jgi:hypothetical protein
MLMVHPSTPHDAPPQRRTPSEVRNNTEEKDYRFGGPHLQYQMGPKENEKRKSQNDTTQDYRPGKKISRHTLTRQVSYKTLISDLYFDSFFLLFEASHLFQHSPTLCVCVCVEGLARLVRFNLFVRRRHLLLCLSIRPKTTTIIDSGWKSSLAAFQRVGLSLSWPASTGNK